jgi:DNA modification methylase
VTQFRLDKYLEEDNDTDPLMHIDWDFKHADTKEFTHGIHVYPARMVPQIARALIQRFSEPGQTVLDPFCGSGTVLLEALLANRRGIGVDINPLATLIAQVKTTSFDTETLLSELRKLEERIRSRAYDIESGKTSIPVRIFEKQKQIDHWFKPVAQEHLTIIREVVEEHCSPQTKQFFRVIFSDTVRKISNTRDNEYKLYRLSPKDLEEYEPDGIRTFLQFSRDAIKGMKQLHEEMNDKTALTPRILLDDFTKVDFGDEQFDLMVTSPPYGDSQTTVGYGQFSKYSLLWLGEEYASNITTSSDMLGGKQRKDRVHSPTLKQQLKEIRENETDLKNKREKVVNSFFADYQDCVLKVFEVLKDRGVACFVVGNRSVREVRIRMDLITKEIGEFYGFTHYLTIPRNIPTKRQPFTQKLYVDPKWKGVEEKRKATQIDNIVKEHIIILQK